MQIYYVKLVEKNLTENQEFAEGHALLPTLFVLAYNGCCAEAGLALSGRVDGLHSELVLLALLQVGNSVVGVLDRVVINLLPVPIRFALLNNIT